MMELTFRAYKKEDFTPLRNIIQKTWHYDTFSSPKTASKLAGIFLNSCLTNYTFSCVALSDGHPVGIILGKNISAHKCPLKYRLKQIFSILSLYRSKEGRRVFKIFKGVNGIDRQLLAECNKNYPAELALFAVDSACRGKGIGKMLFQSLLDYMNEQRLPEFFLFTDTSCNYGFYEHQGMTQRCRKSRTFHIYNQKANMTFFIYDYKL